MNPVSKARGAALLALAFAMAGLTACGHAAPPPGRPPAYDQGVTRGDWQA